MLLVINAFQIRNGTKTESVRHNWFRSEQFTQDQFPHIKKQTHVELNGKRNTNLHNCKHMEFLSYSVIQQQFELNFTKPNFTSSYHTLISCSNAGVL